MLNDGTLIDSCSANRFGCYAGFPDPTKIGKCATCARLGMDKKTPVCTKYKELTGRKGSRINLNTPACRYYEQK